MLKKDLSLFATSKSLIPFLLVAFIACNDKPSTKPAKAENAAYTKTMEYAVDLNSVFHEDLNDEDFSDVSIISENLVSDVLSGKLTAYDRFTDEKLSTAEVKSLLHFTDTVQFFDPETGEVSSSDIVERDYTKDFYGFTFREKWSYDKEGSVVDREVVAIAPRIPVYSKQGGALRGYTSAFWIKYD
jgi:hypothetical protein